MTRTIYVVGIGAGHPEHLTLQAVAAMNRVDVFFTIDKAAVDGGATADLAALRTELLDRHAVRPHRVVTAPEVPRDRDPVAYVATAAEWQARREAVYEHMITSELADGETGGFLVWGDPSLYDGTLNLLHHIAERATDKIEIVSIPGISSVAALAAAHGLILNRVGTPVLITTGRRIAEQGMPRDVDDVVVMLDGRTAFAGLPDTDLDVYWGAYLGTPDEIRVAGDLQSVRDEICGLRQEARARKGWIMDIYLLRRRHRDATETYRAQAAVDDPHRRCESGTGAGFGPLTVITTPQAVTSRGPNVPPPRRPAALPGRVARVAEWIRRRTPATGRRRLHGRE